MEWGTHIRHPSLTPLGMCTRRTNREINSGCGEGAGMIILSRRGTGLGKSCISSDMGLLWEYRHGAEPAHAAENS